MRVLFLSPRQSLPARSGAKLREYHFLRALGRAAEVHYLYFVDPGATPIAKTDLSFCREVRGIPKPPAYGPLNTAKGIFGRWPLPVLNYTSAEMYQATKEAVEANDFDIIHLDSIHMIRYAQAAAAHKPRIKAIYNWHNIESEAMRRYSQTSASAARRWYAAHTAGRMETLEADTLHKAFGHIVCSEREREQLLRIAPDARIAVVENGVDTAYFRGAGGKDETKTRTIVFVGAMDYFPNSDAAVHFARQIWPQVRERLGDVRLIIAGANPGPGVTALRELPGIEVTGTVPDLRPYYHNALAAVVPLRTGGGTRLKILEAMAAGVPVISTPLGAEGLQVTDGANVLLVKPENTQAWCDRIATLAESPVLRGRMIASGRQLVETRYDWEILGSRLEETYSAWLSAAG